MYDALHRPDWIMVGCRSGEGVMLVASRSLATVDLTVEYEDEHVIVHGLREPLRLGQPKIEMTCVFRDHALVYAPDYGRAFEMMEEMFREWDARYRPRRVELDEPVPGLPERRALPHPEGGRY